MSERGRIQALLFCSGAAGLVFEVGWARQLAVRLGLGEQGAALTLVAFFAGMALGQAAAGRLAPGLSRPLRGYAACEAFITLWALALPSLLEHGAGGAAALWLVPPCAAMGASLPFALEALSTAAGLVARGYAVHLAGAGVGGAGATFVLIERYGVVASTQLACASTGLCALAAWAMARERAPGASPWPPPLESLWAAGLAGAATLSLQVLALRLFALTFHNSTYSFGLVVAVFIVCLALGSRLVSRRALEADRAGPFGARLALLASLGVLLIAPLFAALTRFGTVRAPSLGSYVMLASGVVAAVLALPVICAGTLLPVLWLRARGRVGRTVGSLGAANAAGGAAGALVATFVILPALGPVDGLCVAAVPYAALALWLAPSRRTWLWSCVLLVPLAFVAARVTPAVPDGYTLGAHWESSYGRLDLLRKRADGSLSARLDLHYQLGSSADRARHVRMGSVPLALHGSPRRVLFLGLATGMTASAALSVPGIERIEVAELIPEVREVARAFAPFNGRLLDDSRVRLALGDARAFLRRSESKRDVIVSDLFIPWHSQAAYLYTVEHYRAVYGRLSPSGVFCQWLPLWQLGARDLALIADSFVAAFPRAFVVLDDADPEKPLLALVFAPSLARLPASVRSLGIWPRRTAALLNTDDRPRLEFWAPHTERRQDFLVGERLRRWLAARAD